MLSITGERPAPHGDADVVLCERPHARFSRQLYLGENLDTAGVKASYDNGVLTITIPVSQQGAPGRSTSQAAGVGRSTSAAPRSSHPSAGPRRLVRHMRASDAFSWHMERDPLLRSTVMVVLVFAHCPPGR